MKKVIIIRKKDNKITMYGNVDFDKKIFKKKEITITKDEFEKINYTNESFYKNGKLSFKRFGTVVRKEELEKIKNEIKSITDINILKDKIIQLLYNQ